MEYRATEKPETALQVQRALDRFRECQRYVFKLPKRSEERRALEPTINLAYYYLQEIMEANGIEEPEDMLAFELGNISKWKGRP